MPIQPVYLALVDLCCDEEFLELVRSALLAALEALPPSAVFGLVTFSDKVGVCMGSCPYEVKVPLVHEYVHSDSALPPMCAH